MQLSNRIRQKVATARLRFLLFSGQR